MCIIIDTNCLADVFNKESKRHKEFKPVLDWILHDIGKMVVGGSKYKDELRRNGTARRFVQILRQKANKVILIEDNAVDNWQKKIEIKINHPDFDDPHLPAMVIVGKCHLICSGDLRSVEHVTRKDIYPKGIQPPKYYTRLRNADLLCAKNIDKRYLPLHKCTKYVRTFLEEKLEQKR